MPGTGMEEQPEVSGSMQEPVGIPTKPQKRIHKFQITSVDLVDEAANLKTFHVRKSRRPAMKPGRISIVEFCKKALSSEDGFDLSGYADLHVYFEPEQMIMLLAQLASMKPTAKGIENALKNKKGNLGAKQPVRKNAAAYPSADEMAEVFKMLGALAVKASETLAKYPDYTVPNYPNVQAPTAFPKEKAVLFPDLMTIPGAGTNLGLGDAPSNEASAPGANQEEPQNPGPVLGGKDLELFNQEVIKATTGVVAPVLSLLQGIQTQLGEALKPAIVEAAVTKAVKPVSDALLAEQEARKAADAKTAGLEAQLTEKSAQLERATRQLDLVRAPPTGGGELVPTAAEKAAADLARKSKESTSPFAGSPLVSGLTGAKR